MSISKKIVLSIGLATAMAFVGCGRMASSAPADPYLKGELNEGEDLNEGVTNETAGTPDQNTGVIHSENPANENGVQVPGGSLYNPDGSCVNDTDEDGICNELDDDIDGDKIPNTQDDDIDGDDVSNTEDNDIDGDGIDNIHDNDIDGDGVANVNDSDIDGDGTPNTMDDDMDGDGISNIDDNDIDGDGISNSKDDDIDGDGISNSQDDDIDGDGVANEIDNDVNGDGVADNDGTSDDSENTGSGKEVYFTKKGSVTFEVEQGALSGSGEDYLDLREMRDSAKAKDADTSTITPLTILVKADPSAESVLSTHGSMAFTARIYYQIGNEAPVVLAMTPAGAQNQVKDLIDGVSFDDGTLLPTKFFGSFQEACKNGNYTKIKMMVDLELSEAAPITIDLPVHYEVTASAIANVSL